ncbi:hypothetical protein [Streptomyces sp. NRRL S-337]|uniref:hypothetical protein n=1 Tax=Streptomyces sp. NRRL S-337 TaxID=1463900 RepID=UPI000AE97188|nr:hypothetical protein [Streptomyces sp. NRRL S-337]
MIAAAAVVGTGGTGTLITGPPRRTYRVDESWVTLPAGFRSSQPSVPISSGASRGGAV